MQNLESYRSFYMAARFENFTRAAEELFVTQSSVSQSVKKLETSLGIDLFLRRGRRVQLTEEGKVLYKELDKVFKTLEDAERLMMEYKSVEKGSLSLAASDTICRHYLLPVLKSYKEEFPHIHINIINQPSPIVAELVRTGQVDLGFVNGQSSDYSDLVPLALLNLKEQFFCAEKSPIPKRTLSLEELLDYPQVCLKQQTSTRQLLDDLFRKERLKFQPEVEVISIDLLIDLIRVGFGIGFSHSHLIKKEGLRLIKVDQDLPQRKLLLLTNPRISPSKAGGLFLDLCHSFFFCHSA
ncbi:MAG TPA: LysR family transcriptional regulator [Clostridia bacterium]|nr:LysR family transcriptional regulator [Clostridia bacterium]